MYLASPLCVCMCVVLTCEYMSMSAYTEARGGCQTITPSVSALFTWEKACHWPGRSLCWPSWLTSKILGSARLCPLMLVIGACNMPDCLEEYWRGCQTLIRTLAQKMLLQSYCLISLTSILISSCCCFFGISPLNQRLFLMTLIFSIRYHHLSFHIWR